MRSFRGFVAITLAMLFFVMLFAIPITKASNVYEDLELLGQTLTIVRDAYVDRVEFSFLVENALKSMIESLDQHSTYLDVEELEVMEEEAEGRFGGVGMVVGLRRGVITVVSPIHGSPASRAGLRPGDMVIEIDGLTTQGMSLRRAVSKLRGETGEPVSLNIRRPGIDDPFEVRITREEIEVPNVPFVFPVETSNGSLIGYVRLVSFTKTTAASFAKALNTLVGKGCSGFVIDLRGNPGGLLDQAIKVADYLLPEGELVCYTIGDKGKTRVEYLSKQPSLVGDAPIVALIGEGSASGAEIVGGALQDNERGVLVGKVSFGKGTVQELRDLGDGAALKITTARWFTPDGYCIDGELGMVDTTRVLSDGNPRKGLVPNVTVSEDQQPRQIVDLIATAIPEFVTFYVESTEPVVIEPEMYHPGPELLEAMSLWMEQGFEPADVEPDSVAALVEMVRDGGERLALFVGSRISEVWWGAEGAARFMCSSDDAAKQAISIAGDRVRFSEALQFRDGGLAESDSASQGSLDE